MMTTQTLMQRLAKLGPNLPVVVRMDGFTLERDPRDGEFTDDPVHKNDLSRRRALMPEDIAAVWNSDSGQVTIEITARVLVMVESVDSATVSAALMSASDVAITPRDRK
jgi:hypothetical protein